MNSSGGRGMTRTRGSAPRGGGGRDNNAPNNLIAHHRRGDQNINVVLPNTNPVVPQQLQQPPMFQNYFDQQQQKPNDIPVPQGGGSHRGGFNSFRKRDRGDSGSWQGGDRSMRGGGGGRNRTYMK